MAYRGNFPFGPVGVPGMFNLRREIDRLFEDTFGGNAPAPGAARAPGGQSFTPAVDAREEEREIVLHIDLPGVRPDDVDISVENGLLTVRGQRHQQRKEGQEGRYQFVERSYGAFTRAFHLPQGVDEAQIEAHFEHGELSIRIPKPQQPQPRRIQVQASAGVGTGDRQAQVGSVTGAVNGGGTAGRQAPADLPPGAAHPAHAAGAGDASAGDAGAR